MKKEQKHSFIFEPGIWIGEGKISFSSSPETIHFYTKWLITKDEEKKGYICHQQVEMQGVEESVFNSLFVNDEKPSSFSITLENDLIGQVKGHGVIDSKTIAWEYRSGVDFEGFEVYELQDNGDYMMHAEYSSTDHYRTIVDGRIWKKST